MKRASLSVQRRLSRTRFRLKTLNAQKQKLRLSVFCSCSHLYVQAIDDVKQITVASSSTLSLKQPLNVKGAKVVGLDIASKIKSFCADTDDVAVVFDRGCRIYHGRVAAVADGAREGGLVF